MGTVLVGGIVSAWRSRFSSEAGFVSPVGLNFTKLQTGRRFSVSCLGEDASAGGTPKPRRRKKAGPDLPQEGGTKKQTEKKATRSRKQEAGVEKVSTKSKKTKESEAEREKEEDETDVIEGSEEDVIEGDSIKKRTTRRKPGKIETVAKKLTDKDEDEGEVEKKGARKSRTTKSRLLKSGPDDEQNPKAGRKTRKIAARKSEEGDEDKNLSVDAAEDVKDDGKADEEKRLAKRKKTKRKVQATKLSEETVSVRRPVTDEEADLLYEQEGRWKLMEEERLRLDQRYLEKLASSDEEEEEEYSEDDDDELEEEEVKKPTDHIIDMKFPEKDCYALVESYKPRKIGKDERPPLKNEELWWNHRTPDFTKEHYWSEHQKRQGLPDITLAAMTAMTGRIKLFGDVPSVTEIHIYRARKDVFYEERLRAEEKRRKEIGPMAYYQEWVKAWDKDTSKEAVQKHYEETGEDVAMQLMNMLSYQTKAEFNHMMGTDPRIRRDPLVMRATKEMKRSVFGGDPVYPTINYIKKPGAVVDYRGPNFHEPSPSIVERLLRCGIMKTREEHNKIMAAQMERLQKLAEEESGEESDEEMATAVDIGEDDDDEEVDEAGVDDEDLPFKEDDVAIVPTEELLQIPDEEEDDI